MVTKVWVDGLAGVLLGIILTVVMLGASVGHETGYSRLENDNDINSAYVMLNTKSSNT